MKRYLLLYCNYDPDSYVGHRTVTFEAEDLNDAKRQAKELLDRSYQKIAFEFRLIQIGDHDSGSRLWDRRDSGAAEREYTEQNYWNKSEV